jgi:hypothetical protein
MGARRWIVAAVAALATVPVGFAVADTTELDGEQSEGRLVPAAECDPEANDAWREAGMPRDSYYPACPTAQGAREEAQRFNEERRRGLTAIAASIRRYGDRAEDEAQLNEIEAELEQLGGPLGPPYADAGE